MLVCRYIHWHCASEGRRVACFDGGWCFLNDDTNGPGVGTTSATLNNSGLDGYTFILES